jgi:hypothetical protein
MDNIIGGVNAKPVNEADAMLMQNQMQEAMMKNGKVVQCKTKDCDGEVFVPAMQIINLSAIASPNGKEQVARAEVMVCVKCWAQLNPQKIG